MRCFLMVVVLTAMAVQSMGAELTERRLAWAHYVGWTDPGVVSLSPSEHYEFPVHERGVGFRDEVRRALDMGLDGFFVDVCVQYKWRPGYHDVVGSLLEASEGTGFMVAPCLDGKTDVSNQVDNIVWMLKRYGEHPNYPRIGGKYVVATYVYHEWTPQQWRWMLDECDRRGCPVYLVGNVKPSCGVLVPKVLFEYKDVFDCCYSFAYTGGEVLTVADENRGVASWCVEQKKLFMPCIHPGYIGSWLSGHNASYMPFEGFGKFLRDFHSAMEAGQWLHFTSWNDNVETTLQPMASTPGNRQLLRAATDAFKRLPPSADRIDIAFAYHREELPGTLVRIEALRLPAREGGVAKVSGVLVDNSGRRVASLSEKTLENAWERAEWLIPSAECAQCSELTPKFSMKTEAGTRCAVFPSLAIRTPWIENQVTVHATFSNMAEVKNELLVKRDKCRIHAELTFAAQRPVARAILYRNDRPAAQFRREGQPKGYAGLPLFFRGGCKFDVSLQDGKVVAAMRRGVRKGADGFDWRENKIVNHPAAANFDRVSAWVEGPEDSEIVISTDVDEERRIRLSELARLRQLRLRGGNLLLMTYPDCTLREMPKLDMNSGRLELDLFERPSFAGDVYYVRFELEDGSIAETARIYPCARMKKPCLMPILETDVTMETHPGTEGTPQIAPKVSYREYLTAARQMPVRGTHRLMRDVSPLSLRREFWPLETDGRSLISDRWAYSDKSKFEVGPEGRRALSFEGQEGEAVRIPIRMWPMDTAVIELDVAPREIRSANLLERRGYGAAFGLRMLADGRLEAIWSGTGCGGVWKVECANVITAVTSVGVKPNRWTHVRLENDHSAIRIFVDDEEAASKKYDCFRAYGPSTVYLGGSGYVGYVSRLKIMPLVVAGR